MSIVLYINIHPSFGAKPDSDSRKRIQSSVNYDGTHFKNLIPTKASSINISNPSQNQNINDFLANYFFSPQGKNPIKPLPSKPVQAKDLQNEEFIWLGHSTVLFKTHNTTFITDPVFYNAAPVPFAVQPFEMQHKPDINDLPFIDAVLISHDHYDHLDHKAIQQLSAKVGRFYVPLGVKAHLQRWGIPDDKIQEYDWYEDTRINNVQIVFTPTRHFSGRGIFNHQQTLWGSWAVLSPTLKVYFSGDGGYSPEFAKIGERFGGFDIAFMEDGAYNERWKDIHMLPEESAKASIELKAKTVLPIHWAKFDLATHTWTDPIERISKSLDTYNASQTDENKIHLATPVIGETFSLNNLPQKPWWKTQQ